MKKIMMPFITVALVLCFILIAGCDNKDSRQTIKDQETVYSLNDLARAMAVDNSWLNSSLINELRYSAVKLNEINGLKHKLGSSLKKISADGLEYEVALELDGRCLTGLMKKSLSSGFPYRVALDPDQFYFPDGLIEEDLAELPVIELPTYLFDGVNQTPVEEIIQLGPNTVFNEPIFYLVLKEIALETGMGKTTVTPGVYISFISANLRTKHDSGNEEFEIYYSDGPSVTYDAFNSSAAYLFDGNSRLDAAGVTRLFPDINSLTLYVAQQPISMRKLDGLGAPSAWRWVSIEDDFNSGEFWRQYFEFNGFKNVDYYDMSDNYLKLGLTSAFHYNAFPLGSDFDDIYTKTGVMNINQDNLSVRLGQNPYKDTDDNYSGSVLGDINWRVGKVTYQ